MPERLDRQQMTAAMRFAETKNPGKEMLPGEPSQYIFVDGAFVELEQIITAYNPPKIIIYDGMVFFDDVDDDGGW